MNEDAQYLESASAETPEPPVILDAQDLERQELLDKAKSREGKESLPHLKIKIFFGFHGSYEDSKGLEKEFSESDIYSPELFGWTELSKQLFIELSQGRITPEQFMKESGFEKHPMAGFARKQAEMVHGSFKPIIFLDFPKGSPLEESREENRFMEDKRWGDLDPNIRDFRKVIADVRSLIREDAHFHNQREDFMLGRLYAGVKEVLAHRTDLAIKQSLKVTMFLGAAHTRVSDLLGEYGQDVSKKFSHESFMYQPGIEAQMLYSSGGSVSNELAAQVLLEVFVSGPLRKLAKNFTADNYKVALFLRKIVSAMSYDDVKKIFSGSSETVPSIFLDLIAEKKIEIPTTPAEFERFISQ